MSTSVVAESSGCSCSDCAPTDAAGSPNRETSANSHCSLRPIVPQSRHRERQYRSGSGSRNQTRIGVSKLISAEEEEPFFNYRSADRKPGFDAVRLRFFVPAFLQKEFIGIKGLVLQIVICGPVKGISAGLGDQLEITAPAPAGRGIIKRRLQFDFLQRLRGG